MNDRTRRLLEWALRGRLLGIIAFQILLIVVFTSVTPSFAGPQNMLGVALNGSVIVLVACAEAVVVITRNYDLSVGSIVGLASYVGMDMARLHPDWGPLIVCIPIGIGAVCGIVNGWLVAYGRVNSVIATLGTLSIYRGLAFIYANGQQVNPDQIPGWIPATVDGNVAGIPTLIIIAVVVVAALALGLRYLPLGRQMYAVGSNPSAGAYYGLRSASVVLRAYLLCGALVGAASFLYAAQVAYIVPFLATGLELTALAAVVIGGVSFFGGSGNVIGAAIGALALATIASGLVHLAAPDYVRQFVQGAAIILAVALDALISGRARGMLGTVRARVGAQ